MGTLNNRFQYAWYGACDEQEQCKPFIFKDNPTLLSNAVEMISSFTTDSVNNSINFYKPELGEGDLSRFECGGMYAITLRPGKTLNVPHLTAAGNETIKVGENELASKISFTCSSVYEETPTPTKAECIPSTYIKVPITKVNQVVQIDSKSHSFVAFAPGDIVGLDTEFLVSSVPTNVRVKLPSGITSQIILSNLEPKSTGGMLYLEKETACFGGSFQREDNVWVVNLQLISGVAPTPTPEKTPTPQPSTSCKCVGSEFTNVEIDSALVVANGNSYAGFTPGVEIAYETDTMKSGASNSVVLVLPNGVEAGRIIFARHEADNTQFVLKSGAVCYTATATSQNRGNTGNWNLTMVVLKTLSGECGDTSELPTPTPKAPEPTPTPKAPEPTPTPKPQTNCCPSAFTSVNTDGILQKENIHEITLDSGKQLTILKWQGFASGGTLCVDLRETDTSAINDSEVMKFISLPENPSTAIGTVTRVRTNTQTDEFYYTDNNNNCYRGNYKASTGNSYTSPHVLEKV